MGSFLQKERKRLGITASEVQQCIDVGRSTYTRWESGNPIPSDKLNELSKLGFDINFVVTGERGSKAAFNKVNYDRAIKIVMQYVIRSGREVDDENKFIDVVNDVYRVIEKCEYDNQELDQYEIGAKIFNLFAA